MQVKSLADLQSGMPVAVLAQQQGSGELLALFVMTRLQVDKAGGEITAVDTSANTFTLHTRRSDQDLTIKVDEKSTMARYALGDFYRRTGKIELAEAEFVEVTRITPKDVGVWMTLGNFYAP
jgi:Flp pilus assembly protein TadD